jgi:hypothetical protein
MYKSNILFSRLMVIPYLLNKIVARISQTLRKLMTISHAAETSVTVWRNRIVVVLLRHQPPKKKPLNDAQIGGHFIFIPL